MSKLKSINSSCVCVCVVNHSTQTPRKEERTGLIAPLEGGLRLKPLISDWRAD